VSEDKNAIERVLDLFVYAPLGLAFSAGEVFAELVEKGRQQVIAARMLGEYTIKHPESVAGVLGLPLGRPAPPPAPEAPPAPPAPPAAQPAPEAVDARDGAAEGNGQVPAPPRPTADLAIPGYDTLSAPQVVQRLSGLSEDELEAVRAYEEAGRHRKTILTKVAQLQSGL
jgi:hypothetical protein